MSTLSMLLLGIFGVFGIVVCILVSRFISGNVDQIFTETKDNRAIIHTKCMLREGGLECPGVVQVLDDKLIVIMAIKKRFSIPLSNIRFIKENIGYGKYPWIGKRVFHFDTPQTKKLAIGVKNPDPWRQLFSSNNP